jgi:hypothetical protein
MRRALVCLFFAGLLPAQDVHSGYFLRNLELTGPTEHRRSEEPIWVQEYPRLRMSYRAEGLRADDTPILTLRPGAVGPVTPGGTNRENPFAQGRPVVALRARDLAGRANLEVDLKGKVVTAQVDQLHFSVPAGARLTIEQLEFRSLDPTPCVAVIALPISAHPLPVQGLPCEGAAATTLRGKEAVRVAAKGRRGESLFLALTALLAVADKEIRDPALAVARLQYAGGGVEEQFPMLVSETRHVLLNRQARLYGLTLDPARALESVELVDRSPHLQLIVHSAGISSEPLEWRDPELPPSAPAASKPPASPPDLRYSRWFSLSKGAEAWIKPSLAMRDEPGRKVLALELINSGPLPADFTLSFPAVEMDPGGEGEDVFYLFPRQGAIISNKGRALEAAYSGRFPLQFIDVFGPRTNRGAAVIYQDTSGAAKTFRLRKQGASVFIEVQHRMRLAPGEKVRMADAVIAYHGGDWRQGLEAYRAWVRTWNPPREPRAPWLRSAFWCRRDYPVGGTDRLFDARSGKYTFPELVRDGEAFGGIDFIDISGWALSEKVGRVGDYPIELGGAQDLRQNIAWAQSQGIPTGLYFEGFLIDKNSNVGRRYGAQWQMVDAGGQPRWWPGGSPELFVCPHIPEWRSYLAGRIAAVAAEVGADAVYIDEHGFADPGKNCYAANHPHPPGAPPLPGEIAMARQVRAALDAAGRRATAMYLEETPPDVLVPYYDAAFSYNLEHADARLSTAKINLSRFVFPSLRLWDMVSTGVHPRVLWPEDFRLSLWHGNGAWLKGHSDTWYGEDLLTFLRRARQLLKTHAAAFSGAADPLVESPHRAVLVNRFRGGGQTVYTLFNATYRTVRFTFLGKPETLGPRDVLVRAAPAP